MQYSALLRAHIEKLETSQTFQKSALSLIEGFRRSAPFKSFKTIRIWKEVPRFGNFSKRETIESRKFGEASIVVQLGLDPSRSLS